MKRKILNLIMLAVLVFSSYQIIKTYRDNKHNQTVLTEVQTLYKEEIQTTPKGEEQKFPAFKKLQTINPDIIGWLTIADSTINYPVLQTDNNDYYLKHNYQAESARAGSVFKDFRNTNQDEKNTIIYGHNMKDGSMFADIQKYMDKDFFKSHPTFEYNTETENYKVEVFAVYETTTDFYYIETNFNETASFARYLSEVQKMSVYKTDVKVSDEDHIITLSTCDTGFDYEKGRYVVQGKIVKSD